MQQTIEPRVVHLTTRTGISVRRTLPTRQLRTIGAWCFLDHYGPTDDAGSMSVAAHPHAGLQTVSWLFDGQLEHRDSLGTTQVINPGELNLMTAGYGIAHSELSEQSAAPLHGVQLWVVLPDSARNQAPHFEHHGNLPDFNHDGARIRLIMGDLLGHKSPAATYTPLMGAQITLGDEPVRIPAQPGFEYGVLAVETLLTVNGIKVPATNLHSVTDQISPDSELVIEGASGSRAILLGGAPFTESIVMWWNFIGRSHEDVNQMRLDWQSSSERFPAFTDRIGGRIPAPDLPNVPLKSRGR